MCLFNDYKLCDCHVSYDCVSLLQEPAVFVGMVVCEGEGHLNVRSCLLEGVSHASHMHSKGACVRLQIPDSLTCSLFPGQVDSCHILIMYSKGVCVRLQIRLSRLLSLPRTSTLVCMHVSSNLTIVAMSCASHMLVTY